MSLVIDTPEAWPEDDAGTEVGTASNGVLRWAPTWHESGFGDPEKQARFLAWCAAHPEVELPTDQGVLLARDFVRRYADSHAESYTTADAVATLRGYGWTPSDAAYALAEMEKQSHGGTDGSA